jgi:hypothetical protein
MRLRDESRTAAGLTPRRRRRRMLGAEIERIHVVRLPTEEPPMSSATRRCDRIIALIDSCLTDQHDRGRPNSPSPGAVALAPATTWGHLLPTTTPLRDLAFPTIR